MAVCYLLCRIAGEGHGVRVAAQVPQQRQRALGHVDGVGDAQQNQSRARQLQQPRLSELQCTSTWEDMSKFCTCMPLHAICIRTLPGSQKLRQLGTLRVSQAVELR